MPSYFASVHGVILTIAWFGLQNILIWSIFWKQKTSSIVFHALAGVFLISLELIGVMTVIISDGFYEWITFDFFHMTIGFIGFILSPFMLISGAICKYLWSSSTASPRLVHISNKSHKIFGWIFIIINKSPLIASWNRQKPNLMVALVVADVILHCLYFLLRFKQSLKQETELVEEAFDSKQMHEITSKKQLSYYFNNYYVFMDYVFPTDLIITSHPGGWKLVDNIRTREIDRFYFGGEPLEIFPDSHPYSHTEEGFKIAGEPIAKIKHTPIYQMEKLNQAKIISLSVESDDIFILRIKSFKYPFFYFGYTELAQLGTYFTITIHKNYTRLYTMVNFLHFNNLELLQTISLGKSRNYERLIKKMQSSNDEIPLSSNLILEEKNLNHINKNNSYIPIMLKKYDDGKFTTMLLDQQFHRQIYIAQPRGFGLSLQDIGGGKIILMAAGTGLYPFSDLIDLLFKRMLVDLKSKYSSEIIQLSPIVQSEPFFDKWEFELYLAIQSIKSIHPATLFQILELSKNKRLKIFMKVRDTKSMIEQQFRTVNFINDRFEKVLTNLLEQRNTFNQISQFYFCGPTIMVNSSLKVLREYKVDPNKYLIV